LTPGQERLAEALAVQRLHGAEAPVVVAERIGALAVAGDPAGIQRWRDIAVQLDRLIQPKERPSPG
jgi:hypothetical protein